MADNEILKDLFFIERGFLNGNHFVYRSDTPVLIDTGYISGFDETEKSITRLGVKLPDISLIISTHTHCDHIGGNHRIQQKSGCDIALQSRSSSRLIGLVRRGTSGGRSISAPDGIPW